MIAEWAGLVRHQYQAQSRRRALADVAATKDNPVHTIKDERLDPARLEFPAEVGCIALQLTREIGGGDVLFRESGE